MCIIDGKYDYEILLETLDGIEICSIGFKSISLVCRFLDDVNFDVCKVMVFKFSKDGTQVLDPDILLQIWRNE